MPFVSVIVPVRNEARYIERLLGQLLSQHYDPQRFEIIVVDGRSTDNTREIVDQFRGSHENLLLLDNPRRLSSAARNIAVRAAQGEYILLVDGHCEIDNPEYLRDLVDAFSRSGADCIGRPQPLDIPGAGPLQRAIAAARASRLGHHPASFIYSAQEQFVPPQSVAIAYRRDVFDVVGMFDESFDACEDVEFNHRLDQAGCRCFFTPRVTVRYQPRASLVGLFRQLTRYGRGRVRLLRKHSETFSWGSIIPAIFLVLAALGSSAAFISPWLTLAWAAGFGMYVLAVSTASLTIVVRKRDWKLLPWLFLVFPVIHFGAGFGIVKEWLQGWNRSRPTNLTGILPATTRERTSIGSARMG